MKKKIKSMWLYSILMFFVAIILILVSTMSQVRLSPNLSTQSPVAEKNVIEDEEQKVFNQTIQQSLSEIMDENADLDAKVKSLEESNSALQQDNEKLKNVIDAKDMLLKAKNLYEGTQYKKSKEMLMNVNRNILDDEIAEIYDELVNKLAKKGYKFE